MASSPIPKVPLALEPIDLALECISEDLTCQIFRKSMHPDSLQGSFQKHFAIFLNPFQNLSNRLLEE